MIVMEGPMIDPAAVRTRARQVLHLWVPQALPLILQLSSELDSPMMAMTIKGIGMMMPDRPREGFSALLTFLRGLKGCSSEDLQAKAAALVDAIPDEQLIKWGGVLAWVLTGRT